MFPGGALLGHDMVQGHIHPIWSQNQIHSTFEVSSCELVG